MKAKANLLALAAFAAAVPALACVVGPGGYDIAVRTEPVYHTTMRTVCDTVPAPQAQDTGVPAWLGQSLGAVLGAAAGSGIGKGKGNAIATSAGAVLGAQIGCALTDDAKGAKPEQTCRQVPEQRLVGHNIRTRGGSVVFVDVNMGRGL